MKIAFMFPGQGCQYPGMGKDIYDKYEEAQNIYKKATKILDIDMEKLCFYTSKEELAKTQNTQIAIAVTSLAILEVLKKYHIEANVLTGLSLGEYVALIYGNYISLEDGLKLLKKRGYYMDAYIPNEDFSMCAIIGLESKIIEQLCENLQEKGYFVTPSNYNYSMQTVISGNKDAIEIAKDKLKQLGAKRVITLNTSGPFHTKKLDTAKEMFKQELEKVEFRNSDKTVIKNLDGTPYSNKDDIKNILTNHITNPVRFDKTIQYMKKIGIDTFVEIGTGKTLTGFIKKDLKDLDINCFYTDSLDELTNLIQNI